MSAANNLQVQMLFTKSAEDEDTLAFAVPDSVFEFHAQQAIEKLLKALIAAHGEEFPFTHNLQLLLDQLSVIGEHIPPFVPALSSFTRYGVAIRYDAGIPLTAANSHPISCCHQKPARVRDRKGQRSAGSSASALTSGSYTSEFCFSH